MLSPTSLLTPWLLGLVAVLLIALLAMRAIRKDRTEYQHFKTLTDSAARQRILRKWLITSFTTFAGASLVILLLAWQFVPLLLLAVGRWPFVSGYKNWFANDQSLTVGIIVGVVAGVLILTAVAAIAARRATEVPAIGDIQSMLPRNRQELLITGLMSLNAGVVEELLMRLALPALLFGALGNAAVAIIASVVFFGALHVYQGPWGVLGATLIGAVMMGLYLVTGDILVPIVVHAAIDLRSLVVIPVLVYGVQNRSANESEDPPSAI